MAINNPFMGTLSTLGSLTITMIGITVDKIFNTKTVLGQKSGFSDA